MKKSARSTGSQVLTSRQAEVVRLLSQHLTIKEIAGTLGVTESAVNQRIRGSKERLGAYNHRDLIHSFRALEAQNPSNETCSKTAWKNRQLPTGADSPQRFDDTAISSILDFADAGAMLRRAPWEGLKEPVVVPDLLNGPQAGWVRGAAIATICFAVFAALVVGIGAAEGITTLLAERSADPVARNTR